MKNINVNDYQIDYSKIDEFKKEYALETSNIILRHALAGNKISSIVSDQKNSIDTNFDFSIVVNTLPVCDQKQSGRCWIFAACNVLRESIAKEINVSNFELSQNFIAFYDKLEKCNYLISSICDLIDENPDERVLMHLLTNGVSDGGQWDMFVNVVKKYGVIPRNAMKETAQSSGTREMNILINSLIRQFAYKAQKLHKEKNDKAILPLKDDIMSKIYSLLVNCFGVPPTQFDFEYTDKDGKYNSIRNFSPLSFFDKYVGKKLDDYVSIINSPTADKPFLKTYTISYLNNVLEGKCVTHLNLPMERIKELIIAQLKDNQIVWFGSDVGSYRVADTGIWDDLSFDYLSAFGFDIKFNKENMLDYHESVMNHAMCLTGFNIKDNIPNRWKVENSWGVKSGEAGYYLMSGSWFDTYVYQAVINKKYLNKKELDALNENPVELAPWDPMGTLAD